MDDLSSTDEEEDAAPAMPLQSVLLQVDFWLESVS